LSQHGRLHQQLRLGPEEDAAEFLQQVLTTVPAFITRIDSDLRIRYVNQVLPGYTHADTIGMDALEFVAPEEREVARGCFLEVLRTGMPSMYSVRGIGPHETTAHYDNLVTAVQDLDGTRGLCVVTMDVTDKQHAIEEVERSEQTLRVMVEASAVALWDWDLVTGVVHWDERMQALMGSKTPADLTTYVDDFVHPDDRERATAAAAEAISGGEWDSSPHRIIRPSDGEIRWVRSSGKVMMEGGVPVRIIGGTVDHTRLHATEVQLRQAQKMEAIGGLAAGVAHNFNNVLTVILPALELLQAVTPESHMPLVDEAKRSASRAAEMVRHLLRCSGRSQPQTTQVHDLRGLVDEVVAMCQRTFDHRIDLQATTEPDLRVKSDLADIQQVLLNILLNARDAVLKDTNISPKISVRAYRESDRVFIRVEDNGPGIPADLQDRLFQPFVTTKASVGTGLGLAIASTIVREYGGVLVCESQLGEGAIFTVEIPCST